MSKNHFTAEKQLQVASQGGKVHVDFYEIREQMNFKSTFKRKPAA